MREEGLIRLYNLQIDSNQHDFLVMHFLLNDLKNEISKNAFGAVLDIGCGNKPYERLFLPNNILSYTGCDVVQSSGNKVDVICPATALHFPDASFDTVFSTQVIEHVEDPFEMLAEAFRVLKPGGVVIVSAPFSWELHEEPYDFYRYSKYGLRYMFQRAGFSNVEIKANGGKWAAIFQLNINIIYSTFKKKGFFRKIVKGLFLNLRFTALVNKIGLWLDKKYPDELLTLNYVIVGRKK
ncbi:MAG: methyltransferase domain-containing protein [Chitinophagaceae bacterium]|nr:methyltransferase domain-containing protein [Chitinophagaceae bacterium]